LISNIKAYVTQPQLLPPLNIQLKYGWISLQQMNVVSFRNPSPV